MSQKTSITYKNEILEKYRKEKGGEMSNYLLEPTRKQIKEACLWLLNRRNEKYDEGILNRFFKFKEDENRFNAIERMHGDKFKPIINFLNGETKSTTPANLELIAWLIDFKPRPLNVYLKTNHECDDHTEKVVEKRNRSILPQSLAEIVTVPETKVVQRNDKSITIISQINPTLKITTIVSL